MKHRWLHRAAVSLALTGIAAASLHAVFTPAISTAALHNGQIVGLMGKASAQGAAQLQDEAALSALAAVPGVQFSQARLLGGGWFSLGFSRQVTAQQAQAAAAKLEALAEFEKVTTDVFTASPALANQVSTPLWLAPVTSRPVKNHKPASTVRQVIAANFADLDTPGTAKLSVSWVKPSSVFGAKIIRYDIFVSTDSGVSQTKVMSVPASATKAVLQSGLTAGVTTGVAVSAVTKLGKTVKQGLLSPWVNLVPTSLPAKPQFRGSRTIKAGSNPLWVTPTLQQAGGLPVTFTATAMAAGHPSVSCVTTANTCALQGLLPGVTYTVRLTATNSLGSVTADEPFAPTDPKYPQQWYLNQANSIHADGAWQHTRGSSKVVVAVIDSGISKHPELDGQLLRNSDGTVAGYDFVSEAVGSGDGNGWDSDPTDPSGRNDWHGTMVSGVIAAKDNNVGIMGVAPGVKLLEVRAMGETGGLTSDTVAALNWAIGLKVGKVPVNSNPAKVVNISLGSNGSLRCDAGALDALNAAAKLNVTVVTAAGNDARPADFAFPGNCGASLNVSAVGPNGDITPYSDYGTFIDIAAPGGDYKLAALTPSAANGGITTTSNTGKKAYDAPGYVSVQGTSFAAPLVTGVVALMYSLRPSLTTAQVESIIKATATPFASGTSCSHQTPDTSCGVGIINADAAIDAVVALQ